MQAVRFACLHTSCIFRLRFSKFRPTSGPATTTFLGPLCLALSGHPGTSEPLTKLLLPELPIAYSLEPFNPTQTSSVPTPPKTYGSRFEVLCCLCALTCRSYTQCAQRRKIKGTPFIEAPEAMAGQALQSISSKRHPPGVLPEHNAKQCRAQPSNAITHSPKALPPTTQHH
eukprot:1156819-Pelagomonas_calceolata.AAC.1